MNDPNVEYIDFNDFRFVPPLKALLPELSVSRNTTGNDQNDGLSQGPSIKDLSIPVEQSNPPSGLDVRSLSSTLWADLL